MKKYLAALTIVLSLVSAGMIRPDTLVVTGRDEVGNYTAVRPSSGISYVIPESMGGEEGFEDGEVVSALMFTKGTPRITDDDVISVWPTGWYLGWNLKEIEPEPIQ